MISERTQLLMQERWRESIPGIYRPRPAGSDLRKFKDLATSSRGSIVCPFDGGTAWPEQRELKDATPAHIRELVALMLAA